MKVENINLGSTLAKYYNKKFGIITYSGTLAIEVALTNIGLEKNANILVSSNVCYSIINTILKLQMNPIIVDPINDLYLTEEDIFKVIDKQKIDCIIQVHQYGILNDIGNIKNKYKNIKIIEDVAQAWDIKSNSYFIGKFSDVVVTSFGITKPLKMGIGGGVFYNNDIFIGNVDYCNIESRESNKILLSYLLPICDKIDANELMSIGNKIVKEQRSNVDEYLNILRNQKIFEYIDINDVSNTWHRYPIWVNNEQLYLKIINMISETKLQYQLPHKIDLKDLLMCHGCKKIDNRKKKKYFILLRTKDIDIKLQISILNDVIDKMSVYDR